MGIQPEKMCNLGIKQIITLIGWIVLFVEKIVERNDVFIVHLETPTSFYCILR